MVYLPHYRQVQPSSKFYAQFHNKSVLGELFAKAWPQNHNRALEVFVQNADDPKAAEIIPKMLENNNNNSNVMKSKIMGSALSKGEYPSLEEEDDEEIMRLMSEAKVNNDLKKEAGNLYNRESVKRFES